MTPRRYRVQYWPTSSPVLGVMPWAVVYMRTPRIGSFPVLARCYTRHRAETICKLLNGQNDVERLKDELRVESRTKAAMQVRLNTLKEAYRHATS